MDDYEFQAMAARAVLAVCRREITVEQAVHQLATVEPCVIRNHTCIAHGNNSSSCKEESDG